MRWADGPQRHHRVSSHPVRRVAERVVAAPREVVDPVHLKRAISKRRKPRCDCKKGPGPPTAGRVVINRVGVCALCALCVLWIERDRRERMPTGATPRGVSWTLWMNGLSSECWRSLMCTPRPVSLSETMSSLSLAMKYENVPKMR